MVNVVTGTGIGVAAGSGGKAVHPAKKAILMSRANTATTGFRIIGSRLVPGAITMLTGPSLPVSLLLRRTLLVLRNAGLNDPGHKLRGKRVFGREMEGCG